MAKVKKVEKRSAPTKAAKRVEKSVPKSHYREGDYAKLADAIMHGIPKPSKPQPPPKNAYIEKMGKPKEAKPSKKAKLVRSDKWPYVKKEEPVPKKPAEPEAPKIEITVRSVYYDGQFLPALCFRKPGALHVPCVAGDPIGGIRKFTIAAPQHDKSTVLQHGYGNLAMPYTPERFAAHMKRLAVAAPVQPEARALLLPYAPDMPHGPATAAVPEPDADPQPVRARMQPGNGSKAPSGPARTGGKELIRTLAAAAGLPPEKVRAKLRASGMRAPYVDEPACRKALGVKA